MTGIIQYERPSDGALAIPCSTEQFGTFIAGLLQTPRKILRLKKQIFDVDLGAILDINSLIDQRIKEQHDYTLASFQAEIFYDDGRSVTLPSVQQLQTYAEPGARRCIAVTLSWVYLIHSPRYDVPQKQSIDLTFSAGLAREDIDLEKRSDLLALTTADISSIAYVIGHTQVTFGYDLANLLDEKMKKIEIRDPFSEFFRSFWGVGLQNFAISVLFIFAAVLSLKMAVGEAPVSIEEFLSREASGFNLLRWAIGATIFFMYYSTGTTLAKIIRKRLSRRRPSFISLSPESKTIAEERLKKFERRWFKAAIALVITVCLGVASSLIASTIWERSKSYIAESGSPAIEPSRGGSENAAES